MVAGFGPATGLAGFGLPVLVEEFTERPAFRIEEVLLEQLD